MPPWLGLRMQPVIPFSGWPTGTAPLIWKIAPWSAKRLRMLVVGGNFTEGTQWTNETMPNKACLAAVQLAQDENCCTPVRTYDSCDFLVKRRSTQTIGCTKSALAAMFRAYSAKPSVPSTPLCTLRFAVVQRRKARNFYYIRYEHFITLTTSICGMGVATTQTFSVSHHTSRGT